MILADEINRTPPKTQAALLEAMQEHQVTAAGVRHPLQEPFFVLATQNPIEMEGTYPLPEAQLDRFMFNVVIDYLPEDDEVAVVTANDQPSSPSRSKPLFHGRRRAALPRTRPQSADRRRPGALRRAAGRGFAAAPARHARFRQRMGELGRWPARRPVPGARRQSPRAAPRPRARDQDDIQTLAVLSCGIASCSTIAPKPRGSMWTESWTGCSSREAGDASGGCESLRSSADDIGYSVSRDARSHAITFHFQECLLRYHLAVRRR